MAIDEESKGDDLEKANEKIWARLTKTVCSDKMLYHYIEGGAR